MPTSYGTKAKKFHSFIIEVFYLVHRDVEHIHGAVVEYGHPRRLWISQVPFSVNHPLICEHNFFCHKERLFIMKIVSRVDYPALVPWTVATNCRAGHGAVHHEILVLERDGTCGSNTREALHPEHGVVPLIELHRVVKRPGSSLWYMMMTSRHVVGINAVRVRHCGGVLLRADTAIESELTLQKQRRASRQTASVLLLQQHVDGMNRTVSGGGR
jgi:hypothetical protein